MKRQDRGQRHTWKQRTGSRRVLLLLPPLPRERKKPRKTLVKAYNHLHLKSSEPGCWWCLARQAKMRAFFTACLLVATWVRRRCFRCTGAMRPCTWRGSWSPSLPWLLCGWCWCSGDRGRATPTTGTPWAHQLGCPLAATFLLCGHCGLGLCCLRSVFPSQGHFCSEEVPGSVWKGF